jgi:hypothetical protein
MPPCSLATPMPPWEDEEDEKPAASKLTSNLGNLWYRINWSNDDDDNDDEDDDDDDDDDNNNNK